MLNLVLHSVSTGFPALSPQGRTQAAARLPQAEIIFLIRLSWFYSNSQPAGLAFSPISDFAAASLTTLKLAIEVPYIRVGDRPS
jgi:hypothetical protein